jgi:hypothetical protein
MENHEAIHHADRIARIVANIPWLPSRPFVQVRQCLRPIPY